ncbi:MAG: Asp-tRNA(Asn)/Glu-tRNA(Gln) amidotransferase subunit GatB [Nanoarchaeota archaeon]
MGKTVAIQKIQEGMIGLEVHCYIKTKEKLFCRCAAHREKDVRPNTFVCATCTGMPGAKPMLPNKSAVEKAVQIGLMLGCKINEEFRWYRKHYDWPDLPKGYQNTISGKHALPVGMKGEFYGIKISSMHLEEDPASWEPDTGKVDYNRSGLPLVEIVTEPDFSTAEEVVEWLKKLLHNLSYLKAVDSNAGIKVDVNVSIPGKTERIEIKNINSLENIGKAIEYELERQRHDGGKERETRRFDEAKGITMKMREKESGEDYRFIVEPDLIHIVLEKRMINDLEKSLPESPDEKLKKLITKYKIDKYHADILTKNIDIVEFYESVAEKIDAKFVLSWVTVELLRVLNYNKKTLAEVDIKVEHFVELLRLVKEGKITELQGKQILNKFYPKSFMPENVEEKISGREELERIIRKVAGENPKAVADYKKGEKQAFNFLMGEVMRVTKRRADFKIARKVLEKVLKN